MLNYENVKLWFAKSGDRIITIGEVNDKNKHNAYYCPVCGSNLKPKAINSSRITPHFAHIDSSKCNSESQIHFWFKHKFLEKGDMFSIAADKIRKFKCKEILVEEEYSAGEHLYRPDVTVLTECGYTIYFEMAFSNKKKIKDYLDIWLELRNIVVEIDIKQLLDKDMTLSFKALFYDGKCFNTKRSDKYYNIIGKYKEKTLSRNVDEKVKERIRKLDWFWNELVKYKKGLVSIGELSEIVQFVNITEKYLILNLLEKATCNNLKSLRNDLKEEIKRFEEMDNVAYLDNPLPKDAPLKKAVQKLNRKYKKIDKRFKISLLRESHKYKDHSYFRGRKVGVWKVSSYRYDLIMEHELNDSWCLENINITNRIIEMDEMDEIYDLLDRKIANYKLSIECKDCDLKFDLDNSELVFYNEKDFELPKRCKSCRQKRKNGGVK